MKVTTDAMVFGALVPGHQARHVLDIGTGTGLLALMLAQRMEAKIDAIEIDADAAQQAVENFEASPWATRLQVHPTALQYFTPAQAYDLMVCNPPFFANQLASPEARKRTARHQGALTSTELLTFMKEHLNPTGQGWIILPPEEALEATALAKGLGLHPHTAFTFHSYPDKPAHRHILSVGHHPPQKESVQPVIFYTDQQRTLTPQATELLLPYYLHL